MRFARFDRLCVASALASFLVMVSSHAARADDAEIRAAIAAHHAAIESRNIAQLAALWVQTPAAMVVNPRDTDVAVGWNAVRSRWEHVFEIMDKLEVRQADGPHVDAAGDAAWSVGVVHVVQHFRKEGMKQVDLVEIDVLVKREGRWLIVSHNARPI